MEWLNIHVPMLRAPEYVGSDPVARATWLNVTAYCIEQENGGRIVGASAWKDRQWQQTCGVTLDEVNSAKMLLIKDSEDIVLWRYPSEKEKAVQTQREAGKRGGRPPNKTPEQPSGKPCGNPRVNGRVNPAETLPHNGKEGEGKGNRKKKEKEKGKEAGVIFPGCLNVPDFIQAWSDYMSYRKNKPLKEQSIVAKLQELSEWGSAEAIRSIRITIANGWSGLFRPKDDLFGQGIKSKGAAAIRPGEGPIAVNVDDLPDYQP